MRRARTMVQVVAAGIAERPEQIKVIVSLNGLREVEVLFRCWRLIELKDALHDLFRFREHASGSG